MKNIIAYSAEKLYRDFEKADELFLSSRMKEKTACRGSKKGCSRAYGSPVHRHGSYAV